jgi:hypothetical protein
VDLDANSILASLLVSSIGFVAFVYGKKQGRTPQMVSGLLLMGFPYFVSNVWLMFGIAAGLIGLMALALRAGM